jgi:hypothetical protein
MDLILPREPVSKMVFSTNHGGKMTLSLFFTASLLGVLGRGSPFLILGILLIVPMFWVEVVPFSLLEFFLLFLCFG